MQIVVSIKQVPDTTEIRIDPKTNTLIRQGVPSIVNPYDMHAVEEAIRLRDRFGGRVTVISMGPPQAKAALKKCIALGADEAILLSDRLFGGSDTLATSYVLSQAIIKIRDENGLDLVLCGKQAIDGDTAQVGPGIARRLGLQQLTYVETIEEIDPASKTIAVRRHLDDGSEIVKTRLPAMITVVKEINEIRHAGLKHLMRASRYEIPVWTSAQLGIDVTKVGLKGSPTSVAKSFVPQPRGGGELINAAPQEAACDVVARLFATDLPARIGWKGASQNV